MTVKKFILIDYSEVFFRTISKSHIPSERGGKFIQIRNENTEYLVLSPRELSSFHANIIERFCMLNGLTGEYTTKKMDEYDITDPDWIIIGGGKWFFNDHEKWIHLFDKSGVYGKFDHTGLRDKILSSENFKEYDIRITA